MPLPLRAVALSAALVGVLGCYDPKLVTAPDDILLLQATPSAIPADGFSRAEIVARVSPSTSPGVRVQLTTSGGALSPTDPRAPDSNGEVSALLTSTATPQSVLVTAEVRDGLTVVASRTVTVRFDAASPNSVLRLVLSAPQIEADGASSIQVRAEVNPGLPNRAVTFKTTDGSFVRDADTKEVANLQTGSDGVARAQLYAPRTIGTALVTATASGFSAGSTVAFVLAPPDGITLSATPLEVSRALETNKITLLARLSRTVGRVTINSRVDFSIVNDVSGLSFGRFQDIRRSTDNELATAEFVPGASAPLGLATITARAPDGNVISQVRVNIIP